MTSITAQQTKLDLELVPKENRFDIGKCNGRIPFGFSPREPTFQVVLDALTLTPCYPAFLITADVPEGREFDPLPSEEDTMSFLRDLGHTGVINSLNDVVVDQMHQPWRTFKNIDYVELLWEDFTYQINNKEFKKQEKMYYHRFTKAIIHHFLLQEKSLSWRNRIGMHTSKDDYLINTLRFFSRKEASQKYGAVLHDYLTILEMKEKTSPSKKESELVPGYEEPVKKGKRLKTPAKKSASKPAIGIVIREPLVETKSKGKEKEKVDVARGKGIEQLSEVALTEKALLKEVRKKSLRDFTRHILVVLGNDEDDSNNEQESSDKDSEQENASDEQESESEQDDENEDDDQEDEESDHENESEDDETKSVKGDQGIDDSTDQFDDDADTRLEEPAETATETVQGEDTDAEMTEAQQGNENLETTQEQVVEDAHVTISSVTKKTEGPVASSSLSSDLATKFLNFSDIPQTDAEIVITALEKEVVELKKDHLHTQVTSLVDSHLDTRLGETREEFMNFLSKFLTARIKEQVKDQLPQILPQEVCNLAPPVIETLIRESRDEVNLARSSSQPQSTYEADSTLTEFELKKILIDKMEKSESYLAAPEHIVCYDDLKKSYALDQDFFQFYDVYSLKRSQEDKDKDEDPSARSD
ncbi:hypothetical protein Tco_1319570 [Tanacetum coccineum]